MFAADGLRSPIRAELGLGEAARFPARLGIRRHFATAPWAEFVEIHWSPSAEAYVTPVGPNEVGVAILYSADAQPPGAGDPFSRWMHAFPALAERLGDPVSKARGAGPFEQRVKTPMDGRVLLIGDAAGYLDPLTGEGVRLGFDTAAAAVQAVVSARPESFPGMWRGALRRYWVLTSGLLFIRRRVWLRRRLVRFLARFPRIFRFALDSLNHV
jgi:flavin-dependent dehydrogenase